MFGVKAFDIVIGNPPYIQLQKDGGLLAKRYTNQGYETFERTGDVYCLFYEKGNTLLEKNGVLCYITSNKWMRAGYGQSTRDFFSKYTNPIQLIDFAGQKIFESATVDTNILLLSKDKNRQQTLACIIKEKALNNLSSYFRQHASKGSFSTNQSWVVLSPIEQRIKEKIEKVGTPLKDWDINIYRGILTGYNEAFIINGKKKDELIAEDPKSAEIIRPILRGRDIKRYSYEFCDLWLINTHNGIKEKGVKSIDIDNYPAIKTHLDNFYPQLISRADKGATPYNLRNCAYIEDFSKQKIVWAELARTGNAFTFDETGYFVGNTGYILVINQSLKNPVSYEYLLAFLNSKAILFYLDIISTRLDETGWRWLRQYVEWLPVPIIKVDEQNDFINKIVKDQLSKKTTLGQNEIDSFVNRIFGFTNEEIDFIQKFH